MICITFISMVLYIWMHFSVFLTVKNLVATYLFLWSPCFTRSRHLSVFPRRKNCCHPYTPAYSGPFSLKYSSEEEKTKSKALLFHCLSINKNSVSWKVYKMSSDFPPAQLETESFGNWIMSSALDLAQCQWDLLPHFWEGKKWFFKKFYLLTPINILLVYFPSSCIDTSYCGCRLTTQSQFQVGIHVCLQSKSLIRVQ